MNIMVYFGLETVDLAKPRAGSSQLFNFMQRIRDHACREDPVAVMR